MRQPPENSAIGRCEIGVGEAEPAQDFRRPRRRAVGVDGVEPLIDLRQLFGFGGLQRGVERFAPRVGGQDRVEEADRRRRVLLIDRADPRRFRQQDLAARAAPDRRG